MREKPKDDTRLRHMLEAINNVIEFTTDVTFEEYSRNKILRFAVIKNLDERRRQGWLAAGGADRH